MSIGPRLVILGTIVGSMILALFTFIATAGAAPLEDPTATNGSNSPQEIAGNQNANDKNQAKAKRKKLSGDCNVSNNYPESIMQWCGLITQYAKEQGLEPNLIAAVMLQESGGQPEAYSKSGAVGLMQVMPRDGKAASFTCINGPCFASRPTIEELKDPEFNVEYGTRMLSGLENRLGTIRDALKSYGPKDVGYYYADKVLAIYERYK
jgi:soluble lytic murein transglycosylase-like protein